MSPDGRDPPRGYASPPCYLHEVEEPPSRAEVMRWRKSERERLIAARLAMPSRVRRAHSERIARFLEEAIGDLAAVTVSTYAPIRGEPGLTTLLDSIVALGGRHALPVVLERGKPMVFRAWAPGEPLERGIWNIPQPPASADVVVPNVVIAPIVGYDAECYRLGYGGGFFDRTLAAMSERPRVFGIGYAEAAIATIHPFPHDVRMTAIVTEEGVIQTR
ncbi:MAG: 5-formyltetrahydrofolate cyclo-ligase [Steroidobacteraceae bacterium]